MIALEGIKVSLATTSEGVARGFRNQQDVAKHDNGDIDADKNNDEKVGDHRNSSIK
jgi:hypothetical protein